MTDAMAEVGRLHVSIDELQLRAGSYIAAMAGAEAAYVTSGAAAGVFLATAACIAGTDLAAIERLPDSSGLANEVLIQRLHRNAYDRAIRDAGGRLIEVGYAPGVPGGSPQRWQLESAITPRTVAIAWPAHAVIGVLRLAEVVKVAHRNGLRVIVDAAAALPPARNLRRFIEEGADLVAFSGGKAIGGPQGTGILIGSEELIRSVALQQQDFPGSIPESWAALGLLGSDVGSIPSVGIGRPMKVGKEAIAGLVAALDRFVNMDEPAELERQTLVLGTIAMSLGESNDYQVEVVPPSAARWGPLLMVRLRGDCAPHRIARIITELESRSPRIFVVEKFVQDGALAIDAATLEEAEAAAVSDALRTSLK